MEKGRPLSRKFIPSVTGFENEEDAATVAVNGEAVVGETERRVVVADADGTLSFRRAPDPDGVRRSALGAAVDDLRDENEAVRVNHCSYFCLQ